MACLQATCPPADRQPQAARGKRYRTDTHRRAIARPCDQAFPPPEARQFCGEG